MGGAIADPSDDPALKMPTPSARCLGGNHSATAFAAAGQLPGSLNPSKKRTPARDQIPVVSACSMAAIDQVEIKTAKPRRVPSRSTR